MKHSPISELDLTNITAKIVFFENLLSYVDNIKYYKTKDIHTSIIVWSYAKKLSRGLW